MKLNRDQVADIISAKIAEAYKEVQIIANRSGDESPTQDERREAIERDLTSLLLETVSQNPPQNGSIDSYHIDGRNVLHTFIGDKAHVTISDVLSDEQANQIIDELNNNL